MNENIIRKLKSIVTILFIFSTILLIIAFITRSSQVLFYRFPRILIGIYVILMAFSYYIKNSWDFTTFSIIFYTVMIALLGLYIIFSALNGNIHHFGILIKLIPFLKDILWLRIW